jgi:autotransporter-associated beta strand protein
MKSPSSIVSGLLALVSLLLAQVVLAGSATWSANPVSNDWNTASNWVPATVPNGPDDVATFGASNISNISISSSITVNSIVYSAGGSSFTVTAAAATSLTFVGDGVQNDSGTTETLVADGGGVGGTIEFAKSASAADITIMSNGATAPGEAGGLVEFGDNSTASGATLIANSGQSRGAVGGEIRFSGAATGGTPRIMVLGGGQLTLRETGQGYVEVGSIEGDGQISLGDDSLAVGTNSRDCIFSGVIRDGTNFVPLYKIGAGTLTLSGANMYTGPLTVILQGTLLVTNKVGSGTGFSSVQLNHGTFGGSGVTYDGVSVIALPGHAFLSPGKDEHTGTLTTGTGFVFNKGGGLKIKIDSALVMADKVMGLNATVTGGRIILIDEGGVALPAGTTFTVIDASNALIGTLNNLPDGGTITAGPNTYQANYKAGGDGHDLTLTVL